jgi:hypothetical protein
MGLGGDAETIMSPLRLADDTPQDVGELVHDLAGDVLVTGIHGGLGDESVGTDQAVIKCLDGQRQYPDLTVGDGNARDDFVCSEPDETPVRIQASSAPSFHRPGQTGFHRPGRIRFPVSWSTPPCGRWPYTLRKHGPKPVGVEPAKERFPLLAFLFDPVIEVAGLQFLRAPGQIGIGHPQAVGQQPLSRGSHLHLFAGYPHLCQAVEFHFIEGYDFIKMIGGLLMDFVDDGFEGCDSGHGNSPFFCWVYGFRRGLMKCHPLLCRNTLRKWYE